VDKEEARELLEAELAAFDVRSYEELAALVGAAKETKTVAGRNGASYQLETRVVWDDHVGGVVRVIGCIDDVGWRVFLPLTSSTLQGST
jgi:hypothetical protein